MYVMGSSHVHCSRGYYRELNYPQRVLLKKADVVIQNTEQRGFMLKVRLSPLRFSFTTNVSEKITYGMNRSNSLNKNDKFLNIVGNLWQERFRI